jgi:ankyrin repeat protein
MDRTALHKAALLGNAERVKELLKKGADPNTQDKYGRTPLHKAALRGHVDVVKLLLERLFKITHRRRWGHVDVVKLLLVYGADPTVEDKDGKTPLDLAKAEGRREVVSVIEEWLRRSGGSSQRCF